MNIHEHQAKKILKKYGAVVPEGVFAFTVEDLVEKAKSLQTEKFVLKAQIHAGGRGKAGSMEMNWLRTKRALRNGITDAVTRNAKSGAMQRLVQERCTGTVATFVPI